MHRCGIRNWENDTLTLREAAEYFHIGQKKMRQIVDENMDANFLLTSGNRVMIKWKRFEEYLNAAWGALICDMLPP